MILYVYFLLVFIGFSYGQNEAVKPYRNYKLIQTWLTDRAEAYRFIEMAKDFRLDIWRGPHLNVSTVFLVAPENFDIVMTNLNSWGLRSELVFNDIQKLIDKEKISNDKARERAFARNKALGKAPAPLDRYARYDEISTWVKSLETDHATIAKVFNVGKTYQGRDILAVRLGYSSSMSKPQILIDACMHAREWLACATLIYITDRLIKGSSNESKALLEKFDWWIVPVFNPDGYEYTHTEFRLWRKTLSPDPDTGCFGTDPNRNFDAGWGNIGSSTFPCADDYRGPFPASEVEVQNGQALLQQLKPKAYFNFHTFSELWLTPWGYTPQLPPTHAEMVRVGNVGARAIAAVYQREFEVGNIWDTIYPASGGSVDYAYDKANVLYPQTLELRPASPLDGGFIMGEENIVPSGEEIYAGVIASIKAMRI